MSTYLLPSAADLISLARVQVPQNQAGSIEYGTARITRHGASTYTWVAAIRVDGVAYQLDCWGVRHRVRADQFTPESFSVLVDGHLPAMCGEFCAVKHCGCGRDAAHGQSTCGRCSR